LRVNNCRQGNYIKQSYPLKLVEILKAFQDNHKLRQVLTTKPAVQTIPKGIIHTDDEERKAQ
jgi:hypothetical protein